MKVLITFACLLLRVVIGTNTYSTTASIKIRLSNRALEYGAESATIAAASMLIGQTLPNESGTSRLPVGKVKYDITGTKIVAFSKPNSSVTLLPDSGISFTSSGGSISLNGNWYYKYHAVVTIKDSGWFEVTAAGIKTNISVVIGMDTTGHLTMRTTGCMSSIFGMGIKFHGGASWLNNLFVRDIKHNMRQHINQKICEGATEIINKVVASKLRTLEMHLDFGKSLQFDFHLVKCPVVNNKYLDLFHKGEFVDKAEPKEAPFEPHPLPNTASAPRMATFWISDYVLSTFAFITETHGLLQYTLTNDDLKKIGKDGFLNTTCPRKECIGKLIPQLSKCCPDIALAVKLRSSGGGKQPQFDIQPEALSGIFSTMASFYKNTTGEAETSLFDVLISVSLSFNVDIEEDVIKTKVTSITTKMKVVHSNIGLVNLLAVEAMVNIATTFWVIPHLNERGRQGFPLPKFEHLELTNPEIKLVKGALQISTDLKYHPNA